MKKIITSLGVVVFVAAVVVGGTGAFFSDTETSTGNVFTAGAIDLKIDNSSYGFDWNRPGVENPTGVWGKNEGNSWALNDLTNQLFFNFIDLKPGDYGEDTISLHVHDNDSYACMAFDLKGTPENGQTEPEAAVDTTLGSNEGELQNYLSFLFWHDDGDNVLEVGEQVIPALSGLSKDIFTGAWLPIAQGGDTPLKALTTKYIGKGWCFGNIAAAPAPVADNPNGPTPGNTGFTCTGVEGNHNIAQTDGISVDVSFMAIQSRNNPNFLCAPKTTPDPLTATVTVDKVVTFSNAAIDGVDVTDFELHLTGPNGDQIVVDEVPTAGLPVGVYTISEVYSGNPANVTFNASFSGGCTEIDDTGVGTMNVVAGINPACVITNSVSLAPIVINNPNGAGGGETNG